MPPFLYAVKKNVNRRKNFGTNIRQRHFGDVKGVSEEKSEENEFDKKAPPAPKSCEGRFFLWANTTDGVRRIPNHPATRPFEGSRIRFFKIRTAS